MPITTPPGKGKEAAAKQAIRPGTQVTEPSTTQTVNR